jgi:hypothetical protein
MVLRRVSVLSIADADTTRTEAAHVVIRVEIRLSKRGVVPVILLPSLKHTRLALRTHTDPHGTNAHTLAHTHRAFVGSHPIFAGAICRWTPTFPTTLVPSSCDSLLVLLLLPHFDSSDPSNALMILSPRRYITSDTGAVADIYMNHKYTPDGETATCAALKDGGCDIDSGCVVVCVVAILRRDVRRCMAALCVASLCIVLCCVGGVVWRVWRRVELFWVLVFSLGVVLSHFRRSFLLVALLGMVSPALLE